jgi:hypothetical protein
VQKDAASNYTQAGTLGFMASRQAYRVLVRLRMPETPTNQEVRVKVFVRVSTHTHNIEAQQIAPPESSDLAPLTTISSPHPPHHPHTRPSPSPPCQ